jgi:hypothetical protein
MPILPVARSQTGGSSVKRRGKGVSSADVGTVSPQIQRAKGLNVPKEAFQSTAGIGAQELGDAAFEAAQRIQITETKIQNREDAVARAGAINQYNEDVAAEIERINVEGDPSLPETSQEFGKFMADKQAELSQAHGESGASEDSMATLTVRLADIESAGTGRMAGLSATAGQAKAKQAFQADVSKLGVNISNDTSSQNIAAQRLALRQSVEDYAGAFTAEEEQAMFDAGNEHLSMVAANVWLNADKPELFEAHMTDPAFASSISPEAQRTLFNKAQTIRGTKDKIIEEIRQIEVVIGRPMTQQEREDHLLKSPTKKAATKVEKETANLVERGFDPNFATDMANGRIRTFGPDKLGKYTTINSVTGQEVEVSPANQAAIEAAIPKPETTPKKAKVSLEDAVVAGTGPFADIQSRISNVFGPFMDGALFQDTTDARQQVQIFSQVAKKALINNSKFAIHEQKIVAKLLPDVDKFFKDPDTARSNLGILKSTLEDFQKAKGKELKKGNISAQREADLIDQVSSIGEILTMMEPPEGTEKAPQVPEGQPEGTRLLKTKSKNGLHVFQRPDGSQFTLTPDEAGSKEKVTTPKEKVTSPLVKNNTEDQGFGIRHDPTQGVKGIGFIEGEHFDADGKRMTEVTVGIKINDKEVDVPAINLLTTKEDMKVIASGKLSRKIFDKAEVAARDRIKKVSQSS